MVGIFCYCDSLNSLDISYFNTSKVVDMSQMFEGLNGLNYIDLSSLNTTNVQYIRQMFSFSIFESFIV